LVRGRAGRLALAALAPAAALVVDPSGWYPFGPSKWLAISTLLLLGSALALHERAVVRVPRSIAVALAALVGWLVLAALTGHDRLYAFEGTPERRFGVLTWALCALALVVGTALDPDDDGRTITTGLLVAGFGVGAVATAEALGWEPRLLDVADRLSGPYGSPAYLGAATALFLPVAMGVALDEGPRMANSSTSPVRADTRGRRVRGWGAMIACALLVVACLGSGARAAWFGLLVAGAMTVVARRRGFGGAVRQHRRAALLGGLGLVAVAFAVVVLTPVGGRLSSLDDPQAAGGRGRVDEWRVAARVVEHHPVLGVGPEGYRTAFDCSVDARYERTHGRRQHPDRAHSGPLDLATSGGLPALAAWLALAALVGRAAWRSLRDGPGWRAGLAAGVIAYESAQLLLFPVVELEPVAWLVGGLLVAADAVRRPAKGVRTVPRVLVPVLGLAALVAVASGATEVVADRRAEVAAEALGRGDHAAAATAALDAERLRPDIVRLHLLAAHAVVADQRGFATGLEHVDDALRVSPRDPIALLDKATFLVARAEATGTDEHLDVAREEVRRQLADDPNDAALWRLQARVEALAGHPRTARRAADRATALTPPDQRP
jgi:O-antigen ligase